jgi:mono/diheme cytochrome c family protein
LCLAFSLLGFTVASCGPQAPNQAPRLEQKGMTLPDPGDNPLGKEVYVTHCKLCHGLDGQMGGSGAANLAISLLSEDEAKAVIAKGRNLMAAYENRLSQEELDAVTRYIQLFKSK